jgi:heat-inducible transcriptional repressor
MISELTSYTSMVLGPSNSRSLVKKIELVKIAPNEALIIIITDTGHVEKRKLFLDGMEISELQNVVKILNGFLVNVPVGDITRKLAYELNSLELKEYLKYHQTLIEAFVRAFSKFNQEQRFMSGQYNLLYEPEFNDVNKVRSFIEAIDNQEIFSIIDKNSKGVTVKIGSENKLQYMEDCTLISVPYQVPTGEIGTIAVIGPKRMNYRKVIPLLEYIAMNMSDFDK